MRVFQDAMGLAEEIVNQKGKLVARVGRSGLDAVCVDEVVHRGGN